MLDQKWIQNALFPVVFTFFRRSFKKAQIGPPSALHRRMDFYTQKAENACGCSQELFFFGAIKSQAPQKLFGSSQDRFIAFLFDPKREPQKGQTWTTILLFENVDF